MRSSKGGGGGINIGGSSILVIFVLLCITTFAALALVSATASYRLAVQVVEASDAYFAADTVAEQMLAQISLVARTATAEEFEARVNELGASYYDGYITYVVSVNSSLFIEVSLRFDGNEITVSSWRLRADYDPDAYGGDALPLLPVFGGS